MTFPPRFFYPFRINEIQSVYEFGTKKEQSYLTRGFTTITHSFPVFHVNIDEMNDVIQANFDQVKYPFPSNDPLSSLNLERVYGCMGNEGGKKNRDSMKYIKYNCTEALPLELYF